MRLLVVAGLLAALEVVADQPPKQALVIPARTKVVLAMTSPVWTRSAGLGDSIYAETAFPVAVDNRMAIPPGTYVRGQIDILTLSSRHDEFRMSFSQMILPGGYVVELAGAAFSTANVVVSSRSDVLLDRGTEVEMVLARPLELDPERVAAAVKLSKAPDISKWASATRCRPIPATPGTSDTVIPGTPGTPGTPDTAIPGGPGMPPTVIPGTPATSGTPDTVIPGTSGTPAMPCPARPAVAAQPVAHKEPFAIDSTVEVSGHQLAAGLYQAAWEGLGPVTDVRILQKGKVIVTTRARVVSVPGVSAGEAIPRTNADGTVSLDAVRFTGRTYALRFDVP
jgi:hypothetical protein